MTASAFPPFLNPSNGGEGRNLGHMADGTLFSAYFLGEGIREGRAYAALDEDRLGLARAALVHAFEGFGTGTTQNEAQTEQDLIFRIFRVLDTLGFPSDLRLPQEGIGNVRRTDVPDLLLFEDAFASRAGPLWHRFRSLCRIIDEGDDALSMPPCNGGLFSRDRDEAARLLDRVEVPDLAFARILDAMARRGGKRINFRDLDVQRLGSIYERLLEFRVVVEDGEARASRDGGARSDSASFYTPEALVRLILVRTVAPLIDEARVAFAGAAKGAKGTRSREDRRAALRDLDPAKRILALRVLDPAMGSGHFLVSLIDMLADAALQAVADALELAGDADYVSPLTARLDAMRETIEAEAKAGGWRLPDDALDDKRLCAAWFSSAASSASI